jgi:hypothetical protein
VVEARREGVLCKGRVRIRVGRIDSVQLQPASHRLPLISPARHDRP